MRIAITSQGTSLKDMMDPRFGRCKYFIVVDIENNEIKNFEAVQNQGFFQAHGAGGRAAQQIGDLGATALISGNLGPTASQVINQLGVKVYQASGVVEDVVLEFIQGRLHELGSANVQAHNGLRGGRFRQQNVEEVRVPLKEKPEAITIEEIGDKILIPLDSKEGLNSKISLHLSKAKHFGILSKSSDEFKFKISDNDIYEYNVDVPVEQLIKRFNPGIIIVRSIDTLTLKLLKEKGVIVKEATAQYVKDIVDNIESLSPL